jgi:leucyl aminopeptidase
MKDSGMEVTFLESVQADEADVVIIIAGKTGGADLVKNKLKSFINAEAVQAALLSDDDPLSYGKIKKLNVISQSNKPIEVIVVGSGERGTITRAGAEKLGGYAFDHITAKNAKVGVYNDIEADLNQAASYIASGLILKSWSFDKYKTKKNEAKIRVICCQTCYSGMNNEVTAGLAAVQEAVFMTREMVAEPANVMTPDKVLDIAISLKKVGVKVSFLERKDMEKLGMNAILGVGGGSAKPTYIIAMEYCSDKTKSRIALVGKGLTFDSGGISIKPSNKMGEMKGDMAGAAAVIGTLKALAQQKSKVNVVGIIGVAENMPSGSAQRPGDVVACMSGKTIEIDNTDAEGRLVLADAICFAESKYNPKIIVTIATLTGAIQVALGHEFAGLFSDSDECSNMMVDSGTAVGEKTWRLPLHQSYRKDIDSQIADVKNVGSGRGAGSTTAALFLKEFVSKPIKFVHLDIAATAWDPEGRALSQRGATGFGVRLLHEFVGRSSARTYKEGQEK